MQRSPPSFEERLSTMAREIAAAGQDIVEGDDQNLEGIRSRAEAICRDIVEAPPELARACVPALQDLSHRLDALAREVEARRDELSQRLAALDDQQSSAR